MQSILIKRKGVQCSEWKYAIDCGNIGIPTLSQEMGLGWPIVNHKYVDYGEDLSLLCLSFPEGWVGVSEGLSVREITLGRWV